MVSLRKLRGKKWTKISTKDFLLGEKSFANVGPLYIEPCKIAPRSMPNHPHVPPIDRGWCAKQCWDVLGGQFVVVVDLEAHVLNEGDILRPILGGEDKGRDCFSLLVNCDSGGRRFGCRQFPPKLIERPLLFHPNPSLCSMEEAGDSAAPKKMETNLFPPRVVTSRLTAMRSSTRRPGSGLTRTFTTSFDGLMTLVPSLE